MHVAPRLRHRFQADPLFRRRLIFSLMALFAVVGWGGFLLCSSALTIRDVEIEGGGPIDSIEAKAAVFQLLDARAAWRPWSPRHRWFIDKAALEEGLKARWFAEAVQVERPTGKNIVRLIVSQQRINLYARTGLQYLEIDTNGVVRQELSTDDRIKIVQRLTGRATPTAHSMIVLEFPYIQEPVTVGYRLSTPVNIIRQSVTLGTLLEKAHIAIRSITHVSEFSPTLTVLDQNGIQVYVDTTISFEEQVQAWSEYIDARSRRLKGVEPAREFIDLRIPGRLYVK